jgi:hypothetical protein
MKTSRRDFLFVARQRRLQNHWRIPFQQPGMSTIVRIFNCFMGVVLLLVTGIFLLLFWPVGIVMGIFAFGYATDDSSLRDWVLQHVETARPVAEGISLVDSQ